MIFLKYLHNARKKKPSCTVASWLRSCSHAPLLSEKAYVQREDKNNVQKEAETSGADQSHFPTTLSVTLTFLLKLLWTWFLSFVPQES